MWERLRRFKALPAPARVLFLRAAILLPIISSSLRLRGFATTQRWLQSWLPSRSPKGSGTADVNLEERITLVERAVTSAARHGMGHPTCLEKSLAVWWLLAREGLASEVRIGVRKDADKLEAHAWVECGGKVLGEREALHKHYGAFDAEFSKLLVEKP